MTRLGTLRAALAALVAVGSTSAAPAPADTMAERTRAAAKIVEQILRQEAAGSAVDRRDLLRPALEQAPRHQAALWHSGFVFDTRHKQWLAVENVPPAAGQDRQLSRYRQIRPNYPDTIAGQLALAEWCLDEKLADQARGHLSRVLELNPDHAAARRLLGFRSINGTWVEERELAAAAERAREALADLRKWKGKVEEIRRGLESRSRRIREAAREKLMAIDDPDAAGTIEQVFCSRGGDLALIGIEQLERLHAFQAAEALTFQAAFFPWEAVRIAAAKALQSHRKHDYVPLLLSAMDTPVRSEVQIFESLDGRLLYRHALYSEEHDQAKVAVVDTPYAHVVGTTGPLGWKPGLRELQNPLSQEERDRVASDRAAAMESARRDAVKKARAREMAVASHNATAELLNARLCSVLGIATGDSRMRSPEQWWYWWDDYNEYYRPPKKPVQTYYRRADAQVAATTFVRKYSCLSGDTIVWTETGPAPISEVKVGDRVFACDLDTGCLTLKPVIGKTIRPVVELLAIQSDGETVKATGGHVFWVAGQGWKKTRELQPGMTFHTMTGTARVEIVADAGEQSPHNLVVADFHTYFVGEGMILTHDNTMRRPTNVIVPGLAATGCETRFAR